MVVTWTVGKIIRRCRGIRSAAGSNRAHPRGPSRLYDGLVISATTRYIRLRLYQMRWLRPPCEAVVWSVRTVSGQIAPYREPRKLA